MAMAQLRVIFDLDDTLYPERDYAIGGFLSAAAWARETLGVTVRVERMTALLDEGYLGQLFPIVLKEANPNHCADDLKGFMRAYQAQRPVLKLFEDAAVAVQSMVGGYSMGLITDGNARSQAAKVEALAIASHFSHIIYTGALGEKRAFHKPHPLSFELMEAALGREGDRFVYIGDNVSKDFVAPNGRGWSSILIDRPETRQTRIHRQQKVAEGGAPQVTLENMTLLVDVLRQL